MRSGAVAAVLLVAAVAAPATAAPPTYDLLSVTSRGKPADAGTYDADLSRTGRYVVFSSAGRNLSTQDSTANEYAEDIYLHDRRTGRTRLVSRATSGKPATGTTPSISPNGRFLAFCSLDKIVRPDTFSLRDFEQYLDVFVRDLRTGVTRRASTTYDGKMADDGACEPHVSNAGDTVFTSAATNLLRRPHAGDDHASYLYDWGSRRLTLLGVGGGAPHSADISADGRVVLFHEDRDRARGDRNGLSDAYVLDRDRERSRVQLVSRRADGTALTGAGCYDMMAISDDGRFALVVCNDGEMADPAIPDGIGHLWLVDRRKETNRLLNPAVQAPGNENPFDTFPLDLAISGDGRTVAYVGRAGNSYGGLPPDEDAVYVWRPGHGLTNLTPAPDQAPQPYAFALSGDGSYLAFTTDSVTISDEDPEDVSGPPQVDLFGVRVP